MVSTWASTSTLPQVASGPASEVAAGGDTTGTETRPAWLPPAPDVVSEVPPAADDPPAPSPLAPPVAPAMVFVNPLLLPESRELPALQAQAMAHMARPANIVSCLGRPVGT